MSFLKTIILAPNKSVPCFHKDVERSGRRFKLIQFAFVLFAFSLPFETVNLGEWAQVESYDSENTMFTLTKLFGYFLLFASLTDWRRCYSWKPWPIYCFAIYFLIYGLRGALGEFSGEVFGRLITRIQMLVFFCIACNLLREDRMRRPVFIAFSLSCALLAALTVSGVLVNETTQTTEAGVQIERLTGLEGDANTAAVILVIGLMAMTSLLIVEAQARILWWMLGCLAGGCLVSAIVATGSRGAMLALAIGYAGFALSERFGSKMIRNGIIGLIAVGCLVSLVFSSESALTRWEAAIYDHNTAGRDHIIAESLDLIAKKPMLGWGPVASERALGSSLGLPTRGAHNLFLGLFLESGFIGAVPYLIGLAGCVCAAWSGRLMNSGALSLALLCVVLITNLSIVWDNRKLHWLVLALSLANYECFRQKISKSYVCKRVKMHVRSSQ